LRIDAAYSNPPFAGKQRIDGGQIQLHVRAPAGTRIEATKAVFQAVKDKIREITRLRAI
jgi:hypothetical protein